MMKKIFFLFCFFGLKILAAQSFTCHQTQIEIIRPEHPNEASNGPFYAGERIQACFKVEFYVSVGNDTFGNGCQWIQGIVPAFGSGWDIDTTVLQSQSPESSIWLGDSMVQYNVENNNLHLLKDSTGQLALSLQGNNPLKAGSYLPRGWWFTSSGSGPTCTNDGDPDNMWGLPSGCGTTQIVNFCLNLKVKDLNQLVDSSSNNLNINLFVFSDGETGCWLNTSCANTAPFQFNAEISCNDFLVVEGEDSIHICSGQDILVQQIGSIPGQQILFEPIDNPNVMGEQPSGVFVNSTVSFTSNLVNIGQEIEKVIYRFLIINQDSTCQSPVKELRIFVHPKPAVELSNATTCKGDCTYLIPLLDSLGVGKYEYQWSDGSRDSVLLVCIDTTTQYTLTAIDSMGCTSSLDAAVFVTQGSNVLVQLPETISIQSGTGLNLPLSAQKPSIYTIVKRSINPDIAVNPIMDTLFMQSFLFQDTLTITGNVDTAYLYYTFQTYDDSISCISPPQTMLVKVYKKSTSTNDEMGDQKFHLYPNPTNGKCFIKGLTTADQIEIYNESGACLLKKSGLTENNMISLQNFDQGLYFIKIDHEGKTYKIPVMKIE